MLDAKAMREFPQTKYFSIPKLGIGNLRNTSILPGYSQDTPRILHTYPVF
jgi:hypothetical protein